MSTEPVGWSTVFSWASSFLLTLQITLGAMEPLCIICVQYIGGGGVFSTSGGYHEYIGGYHEYIGGCSVHRRVTMMQVGGCYNSSGRIS